MTDPQAAVREAQERACSWFLDVAAPLWATRGRTATGLFAERMTLSGEPDPSYFRTFVQARHIYSFVAAGKLGWTGPWRQLVAETIDAIVSKARRADGFYVHRLDAEGAHLDPRADLYDQAFVLFALGTAGGALDRADLYDRAEELLNRIETEWRHPSGGFREGEIVDARTRRQNPHMHLLEAFLALHEASGRARFLDSALKVAHLARRYFIDGHTGALLEYFSDDLSPAAGVQGQIVEPGHCFEWAWLFERLARGGWREGVPIAERLTAFARQHGLDYGRGVAINEILLDGTDNDTNARLWPQTERIKAAVARFRRLRSEFEARELVSAAIGLERYFDVPLPGLWRDKLNANGSWVDELAPGSSFYHIACAFGELLELKDVTIAG